MGDSGILELGRSIIRYFYSDQPVGLTGCTAEGLEDDCAASEYLPKAGSPFADPEDLTSSGFAVYGEPVRFILPWASTCPGYDNDTSSAGSGSITTSTAGLQVTFSLGDIVNAPMTLNEDGSYSITVDAFNWSTDYNAVEITITDLEHDTTITKNMAPPTVIPSSDVDACETHPSPTIAEGYDLQLYPGSNIDARTNVVVAFPLAGALACDGSHDNLSAYLRINGGDPITTDLLDEYLSTDGSVSLDSTHFVYERPFNTGGEYTIVMYIVDESRPEADPVSVSETVYVSACYATEAPDQPEVHTPDDADQVRGSDVVHTWYREGFLDCNDQPYIYLGSPNVTDYLHDPTINYDETTGALEVIGAVLPEVAPGATNVMKFEFENLDGVPYTHEIHLPSINPISLTLETLFIQQEVEATWIASIVPGASNYRFVVTLPSAIDDEESNHNPLTNPLYNHYSYSPTASGEHILNLDITTYTGYSLNADYHFIPAGASVPSESICYTPPVFGVINNTLALHGAIIRGDETVFDIDINSIQDCNGENVTLVDDNTDEIFYAPHPSYDTQFIGQTFSASGPIRSTVINGSSVMVRVMDDYGHMTIISVPIWQMTDPTMLIDSSYVHFSDDILVQLLLEPAGANTTYQYQVTRPNASTFNSGVLTGSSNWLIDSSQTDQLGVYTINGSLNAYDGVSHPMVLAFPVYPD